jgi:ADP-ribose pyrophosphatase
MTQQIQKWQLLSEKDVSPSIWFPIKSRTYKMPNGKVVEDFTITTLGDVVMIIPITDEGKIVMVRQYKPGADQITIEFPAGRKEDKHESFLDAAKHELMEETGIEAGKMAQFVKLSGFPTKGTEMIYGYIAEDLKFTGKQDFDETENIEVVQFTVAEVDSMVETQEVMPVSSVAMWYTAKRKFPQLFR